MGLSLGLDSKVANRSVGQGNQQIKNLIHELGRTALSKLHSPIGSHPSPLTMRPPIDYNDNKSAIRLLKIEKIKSN